MAPDAPDLSPEPGWAEPLRAEKRAHASFVSGDPEGPRLRVRYYRDPATDDRVGKVWFGPMAEGPPGHAHGGSIAAVLDEAMGTNCWQRGHRVLAGTLQIVYRRAVPLGTVARIRTSIERIEGRKVHAAGALVDEAGVVWAEGSGVFVIMKDEMLQHIAEEARRSGRGTPDAY